MLIMALLVPLSMIAFGSKFRKMAPKRINLFFGYRTPKSMKNQDTWKFAHNLCGKLWFFTGIALTPITMVAMLFSFGKSIDYVGFYGTIIIALQIIIMIATIFPVELALKREFDRHGRRK